MKLFHCLLFVFLLNASCLLGQGLYVKAGSNFHISTGTQEMPQYFDFTFPLPVITPDRYVINKSNLRSNKFSVDAGYSFQGEVDYVINNFLSLGLKFSTFKNTEKDFEASPKSQYPLDGKTEWDLRSYSLLPTVYLGQDFGKSRVNIFMFSGLGVNQLDIKALYNHGFEAERNYPAYKSYEFDKSWVFSWGYGVEYAYAITERLSLLANVGVNNSRYNFNGAKLNESSFYGLERMSTYEKEIEYVKEISNIDLVHNAEDSPERRLKEPLKLNSVYVGLGLKYALKK